MSIKRRNKRAWAKCSFCTFAHCTKRVTLRFLTHRFPVDILSPYVFFCRLSFYSIEFRHNGLSRDCSTRVQISYQQQ